MYQLTDLEELEVMEFTNTIDYEERDRELQDINRLEWELKTDSRD